MSSFERVVYSFGCFFQQFTSVTFRQALPCIFLLERNDDDYVRHPRRITDKATRERLSHYEYKKKLRKIIIFDKDIVR